jgi:hypothetical protein
MSVSDAWTNSTPSSVARMNKTGVLSLTGDEIDALDMTKHRKVFCTEDGGAFLKDHSYTVNADEDAWIDETTLETHAHYDDDTGGQFIHVLKKNVQLIDLLIIHPSQILKTNWVQTVTGTGSIEDATDANNVHYIRLRPNGTSGSGSTITYAQPLNIDFGEVSTFVSTQTIETATNLAIHIGINCDDVTAADSNTRKYQAECCTTTNNNWWLRTADGTTNSASDTGIAISSSRQSIRMLRDTDGTPYVILDVDSGTVLQKTTHIPSSGSGTTGNLIKFSIKNSTAADRPLRIWGCKASYYTSSSWGYS